MGPCLIMALLCPIAAIRGQETLYMPSNHTESPQNGKDASQSDRLGIAEFLDDFPTVSRSQAIATLEQAKEP